MSGSDAYESRGTRSEWVRFHVAQVLAWPFWQVAVLGARADKTCCRILWWGERASRNGDEGSHREAG